MSHETRMQHEIGQSHLNAYVNRGDADCEPFLSVSISHFVGGCRSDATMTLRISGDDLRKLADEMDAAYVAYNQPALDAINATDAAQAASQK